MNQLVKNHGGELLTTSKLVFERFDVKGGHRYLLKKIDSIITEEPEFGQRHFSLSSYLSPQNKVIKCYTITRDGFSLLAMGLTGTKAMKWKIEFINAFNKMESHINNSKSVMEEINEAILIMEGDKKIASECARGLVSWRKLKKNHEQSVKKLIERSQMVLGFDSLEQLTKGETK